MAKIYKSEALRGKNEIRFVAIFCLMLSGMTFVLQGQNAPLMKGDGHPECLSYVRIEGSTNVNQFYFQQSLDHEKHAPSFHNKEGYITFSIPAHNFEASNPLMYKDFIQLIKADNYPEISIQFHYNPYDIQLSGAGRSLSILSEVYVTMAGKVMRYKIPGVVHICRDKAMRINGNIKIDLRDFQLSAPSKFMGMVRVSNEVSVEFGVRMEPDLISKN